MKSILITGVSTGIGYGCTKAFISSGYRVFGSVRKEEDGDRLSQEFGDRFFPLIFDVANEDSIKKSTQFFEHVLQDDQLHGLINNAGIAVSGPLLELPLDEIRHQFEVNVFGQIAVTQTFAKYLGATKDFKGTPGKILMISSVSGKLSYPFVGPYCGSKFALEGLSEALRRELLLYGIDVIIIGPGAVKSAIWGKGSAQDSGRWNDSDYFSSLKKMQELMQGLAKNGFELDEFSQKIKRIFELSNPKTRYALVPQKFKNWTLPRLLPDRIIDKQVGKMFDLKRE